MALIAAAGFELLIGVVIGFVLFIIGLFFKQIIVFDSIALGIIAGFAANGIGHLGTALSIGIGAGVFVLLLFLQMTKIGFWLIGVLLSVLWGFIFAFVAWSVTDKSPFWTYGVWVVGALLIMLLHLWSRKNMNQI
ncbi:MAG: hypothetical protein GX129_05375 [Clostridiales bacterium]|jgi:hypothetical protein|nr:hypothetical protein [Clostridiales bacterium]